MNKSALWRVVRTASLTAASLTAASLTAASLVAASLVAASLVGCSEPGQAFPEDAAQSEVTPNADLALAPDGQHADGLTADAPDAPPGICAESCADRDCQTGFQCAEARLPTGIFEVCVPEDGACDCLSSLLSQGALFLCDAGACDGVLACQGGVFSCTAVEPGPERCDGLDNNCDGTTDEGFDDLGLACTGGQGACAEDGVRICTADGLQTECSAHGLADGAPCEDGDACTESACQGGQCAAIGQPGSCDDGKVCTIDTCEAQAGCTHTLVPGACLIDGDCIVKGTPHPSDPCLQCDPKTAADAWSPAQSLGPELCADGFDEDCDGETDEADCQPVLDSQGGAEVVFVSTSGRVSNVITDHGDDTYSTTLGGLVVAGPEATAFATAYQLASEPRTMPVSANPVATYLEAVLMRETLYVDAPQVQIAVQVTDSRGRPVLEGALVSGLVELGGGPSQPLQCTTDALGRCTLVWTADPTLFATAGAATLAVSTPGAAPALLTLNLTQAPLPLTLDAAGGGAKLPAAPVFPGATFEVPILLAGGGAVLGSYDIWVTFDSNAVTPIALNPGTCPAFGMPVSNIAAGAAMLGVLKFNAINQSPSEPCASDPTAHVATVQFEVIAQPAESSPPVDVSIHPVVKDLFSTSLAALSQNSPMWIRDLDGLGFDGKVRVWPNAVMGIAARPQQSLIFDTQSFDGQVASVALEVTGFRRDFSTVGLTGSDTLLTFSDAPQIATLTTDGTISAGGQPGQAQLTVIRGTATAKAHVQVMTADATELVLSDPALQTINETGDAQTGRPSVRVHWSAGAAQPTWAFVQELAPALTFMPDAPLLWDPTTLTVGVTSTGDFSLKVTGQSGVPLGTIPVVAKLAETVTTTGLQVVAPCHVAMLPPAPADPAVDDGQLTLRAAVTGLLTHLGQTCQLHVYALLSDGKRAEITGASGLSFNTDTAAVAGVAADGVVTAQGEGKATILARWFVGDALVAAGKRTVEVGLPEATNISAEPTAIKLAMSAEDGAHTLLGYPTSELLKVWLNLADGSVQEITGATALEVTVSPAGLVEVAPDGAVTPGPKPGSGSLTLSYSTLPPLVIPVTVDTTQSLSFEVFEPYTPVPPRVDEHTLSLIEGTSVWQDARYSVNVTFASGLAQDVTAEATLSATPLVVFSPASGRVTAQAAGSDTLVAHFGGLTASIPGFSVDNIQLDLVAITPALPALQDGTLSGLAGQATAPLQVWGQLSDGTRRRLDQTEAVPGLLAFASLTPALDIDPTGGLTLQKNGYGIVTVTVPATADIGAGSPFQTLEIPCNLRPDCGDFDLGAMSGVPFPAVSVGTEITLQGRLNTCNTGLGAWDIEIYYDSARLAITQVTIDAPATVGFPNWLSLPGTILLNGSVAPGQVVMGPDIPMFTVTATVIAPGNAVLGGKIIDVIQDDGVTTIGLPTPRPMVAADGLLSIVP